MTIKEWKEFEEEHNFIFKKMRNKNDKRRLKKVVHEMRVSNILNNFIKKISRNIMNSEPVDYNPFNERVDRTS